MPGNWGPQMNGVSPSSNMDNSKLEDSMWHLNIQVDKQDGVEDNSNLYPDRPGEPDCIYYLRTGFCGYGNRCRFNHPTKRGQITQSRELPERVGQPNCQYFLKTGTCRFGATCKYHHPRDRHDAEQVPLNILGLPMRQVPTLTLPQRQRRVKRFKHLSQLMNLNGEPEMVTEPSESAQE